MPCCAKHDHIFGLVGWYPVGGDDGDLVKVDII